MKGFVNEHTIWRVVDSHWVNIARTFKNLDGSANHTLLNGTLADYLWLIGLDIPEYITYCLAETDEYKLKFRHYGANINIYLSPNK